MNKKVFEPHSKAEKQKLGVTFIQSALVKTAGRVVSEPEYLPDTPPHVIVAFRLDVQKSTPNTRGLWQSHGESFLVVASAIEAQRLKDGIRVGQPLYVEGHYRIYGWSNDLGEKIRTVQFEATKLQSLSQDRDRSPEKGPERDLS